MLQCWEYANKYKVLDENKEQIFLLKEESDCLARYCCANARPLEGSFQVNKYLHMYSGTTLGFETGGATSNKNF